MKIDNLPTKNSPLFCGNAPETCFTVPWWPLYISWYLRFEQENGDEHWLTISSSKQKGTCDETIVVAVADLRLFKASDVMDSDLVWTTGLTTPSFLSGAVLPTDVAQMSSGKRPAPAGNFIPSRGPNPQMHLSKSLLFATVPFVLATSTGFEHKQRLTLS